ncbi:MAG: MFS transporter [Gaiella sp.]
MISTGDEPLQLNSSRGRWVLTVTILGSAIALLEATVVNVSLPAIGRDLDADLGDLQWVITGYLITLASLILLGGSLGDRLGRRRIFEVGVIWFTVASLACAVAPTIELLIVARVVQGIGGALLTPGSLAIIEASFRREDRARAIGTWSALGGIAAAVGPLLGGWLVDAVSWRAIFLLNLPIGVLVVWASRRYVPETRDPDEAGRLDVRGSVLVTAGLAGGTFALIQAPERGGTSPLVLASAVVAISSLVGFVVLERRMAHPMLPLELFRSRQFTGANLVTFVVYAALSGVFFLLAVFLQISLGYSAIESGAASLPVTVLMLALSSRMGALAQRIGPRLPLTIGPVLIAGGTLLMRGIDIGDSYWTSVLPAVVVFGLGLSLVVAPVTATVLAAADDRHAGIASGVNNAVARTAGLLAVAALPLVAGLASSDYEDPELLAEAFDTAMLVMAALAAAGGVLAFATIRQDLLEETGGDEPTTPPHHCAVAGTPLHARSRQAAGRAAQVAATSQGGEPVSWEGPGAGPR